MSEFEGFIAQQWAEGLAAQLKRIEETADAQTTAVYREVTLGFEGVVRVLGRLEGKLDEALTTLRRHEVALKAGAIGQWGNPPREGEAS